MYYHCSDDGYIVSTLTQCRRELPFVIPLPEHNFIITAANLSIDELIDRLSCMSDAHTDARRIAISAIDDVFRDQENN